MRPPGPYASGGDGQLVAGTNREGASSITRRRSRDSGYARHRDRRPRSVPNAKASYGLARARAIGSVERIANAAWGDYKNRQWGSAPAFAKPDRYRLGMNCIGHARQRGAVGVLSHVPCLHTQQRPPGDRSGLRLSHPRWAMRCTAVVLLKGQPASHPARAQNSASPARVAKTSRPFTVLVSIGDASPMHTTLLN